jgi:hypothetical protein
LKWLRIRKLFLETLTKPSLLPVVFRKAGNLLRWLVLRIRGKKVRG